MLKKQINKFDWALELAAGGPLQIFEHVLVDYPFQVDINELARNQMLETYASEDRIMKQKREKNKFKSYAKIADRFQCNLKNVPLTKPYDIIEGHNVFGYLPDEDLFAFLKRSRVCLLKERADKPGIMVVMD